MAVSPSLPPLPGQAEIDRLRHFSQVDLQPHWRLQRGDLPKAVALSPTQWPQWPLAMLNDRHHVAWPGDRTVLWLGQSWTVPSDLDGYCLENHQIRLDLTWWADQAEIFVNGEAVQAGDLFDCVTRFRLSPAARPGDRFDLALRLVSPGHDRGALVLSRLRFEAIALPGRSCPEPSFVADELTVLGRYLQQFEPGQLDTFAAAVKTLEPETSRQNRVGESLAARMTALRDRLHPLSSLVKQRRIDLLGHAHLDMAWLWPVADTWQAAERTFESVLQLQSEFPTLTFGHSSPALYAWIEAHRPDLFGRIQTAIAQGRWEVIAGPWIEPDCILPSGESLIRQLLYGQRYIQQALGQVNRVAWLPDSFGFCHQLPQILQQGGVEYFVTEKLLWNDTTTFPHGLFRWRSPDGSEILSYMSARIGTQIEPVQMAEYACQWEAATGIGRSLWLPGVGDHGGGPTREMLETAARWQASPFFPTLGFTTVHQYLDRLKEFTRKSSLGESSLQKLDFQKSDFQELDPSPGNPSTAWPLPVWERDLYLEYHRGCYTSHADQKRYNRHSEALLYEAELWSSLASLAVAAPYPKAALEGLWKKVLFNQFHDILPGTSIPEVFAQANQDWEVVLKEGSTLLAAALAAIAGAIALPQPPQADAIPVVLFNSLNWARAAVVALDLPTAEAHAQQEWAWQVRDRRGNPLLSQFQSGAPGQKSRLLCQTPPVPGVGYDLLWLIPTAAATPGPLPGQSPGQSPGQAPAIAPLPVATMILENEKTLENEFLRVTVDPATGDLAQVFAKALNRDILRGPGNQLQAFRDQGQYWDAWNIDPDYEQHRLADSELLSLESLAQGPLEWRLRVVRRMGNSTCTQDYVLQAGSPLLHIVTDIDWQEDHVLLKVAFPLALEANELITETPCSITSRPTRPQNDGEAAQWEVPALRWACLQTPTTDPAPWGVSLLNDCKYGYDAQPNQLRLSLLRASNWPDPGGDRGRHCFTYTLYAHQGTWVEGQTVRRGYDLQHPLRSLTLRDPLPPPLGSPKLFPQAKLLHLGDNSIVLTALKQAEEVSDQWILHGYESTGKKAQLTLSSDLGLQLGAQTDGLERRLPDAEIAPPIERSLRPWQIFTTQVRQDLRPHPPAH